MKFNIKINETSVSSALKYIKKFLKNYKIIPIDKINIKKGSEAYESIYGLCYYPYKNVGYRLSLFVPSIYPNRVITKGPELKGLKKCYTKLANINEALIFIAFHELYHYLSHSNQILGQNIEPKADAFADKHLIKYRKSLIKNNKFKNLE